MRDIKFRAWSGKQMFGHDSFDGLAWKSFRNEFDRPIPFDFGWDEREFYEDYVLMQYSGLKDKNGKEIYEGDILANESYKYPIEVKHGKYICSSDEGYEDESYGFYGKSKNPGRAGYFDVNPLNFEWIEIIGNIHENPELLKENNNAL